MAILAAATAGWAGEPLDPAINSELLEAIRKVNPLVAEIKVMGEVEKGGATYCIVWGELATKDADSSFVEQAAFKIQTGKVNRVNGTRAVIPAQGYLDGELAEALNTDYVERRIEMLGGEEAAQEDLEKRSFMSTEEANTWLAAGYALNPETQLYVRTLKPPLIKAGDYIKEMSGGTPQPAEVQTPREGAGETEKNKTRSLEW